MTQQQPKVTGTRGQWLTDRAIRALLALLLALPYAVRVPLCGWVMARVVAPGGAIAAYAWDMEGGGFPYEPLLALARESGIQFPTTPSPQASRIDVMRELWNGAGLVDVQTREILVRRTFVDFEDYWRMALCAPSLGSKFAAMSAEELEGIRARIRERLPVQADGRITCEARANAVKGQVA